MRVHWVALPVLALFANCAGAADVTFKVIRSFDSPGSSTDTPTYIVEVSPGKFMGTAGNGAEVFTVTADGAYNNIYVFPTNGFSVFGLTPALNNLVYGGGEEMGPTPAISELYSVAPNGALTIYPYNPSTQGGVFNLVQDPDNHLYGFFGIEDRPVTFAQLDYEGNPTTVHTFSAAEGTPYSMFLSADGAFYGLSLLDNYANAGIFRLTTNGTFSWVTQPFTVVSSYYGFAFIQSVSGKFYGTLPYDGAGGSIYEADLDGSMRTIYTFPHENTGTPFSLMEGSDGMLYGTALGENTHGQYDAYSNIFRLDPSNGSFETLYTFYSNECPCRLVQGIDGRIYGISYYQHTGGTFFVLDAGLPPPQPHVGSFAPESGPVGQLVLLWGRNLLGATAVSFNGTPATTFSSPTTQGIWAEVPFGATSGPITVSIPNGAFVTSQSFTVE